MIVIQDPGTWHWFKDVPWTVPLPASRQDLFGMAEKTKKKTSSSRTRGQAEPKSATPSKTGKSPSAGKSAAKSAKSVSEKATSGKTSGSASKPSTSSKGRGSVAKAAPTKVPSPARNRSANAKKDVQSDGHRVSESKSVKPNSGLPKEPKEVTNSSLAAQPSGKSTAGKMNRKSKAKTSTEMGSLFDDAVLQESMTVEPGSQHSRQPEESKITSAENAGVGRVGAVGKSVKQTQPRTNDVLTVVESLEDEPEGTLRHPLSEIIAVTDSQSTGPEETIERNGRIVARDFGILDLHEGIRQALQTVGYSKPTEVQALCLPHTLEGKDLAGFAQTGTGKTAVFLITAGHRLLSEHIASGEKGAPAVLVLVPTRELAAQIETEAASLFQNLKITTMAVYGGSSDIDKQTKALSKRVDLVVATPGRLFDLHRQGVLHLNSVGLLVCDEADRMLDMGFVEDVEKVLSLVSEKSQKMLFSATGSAKVHELAFEYLNEPEYIETTPEQIMPERITQWCYAARAEEKFSVLLASLREEQPNCAIVFTNTKVVAEWVGYKLAANGIEAEALTGDLPQNRRLALIKKIKNGELKVLVATDVLSRGLHVTGLSHVYNFDVPDEPESFIHRIGRTARAGEKGTAITLVCEDYGFNMGAVEDLLGFSVPVKPIRDAFLKIEDRSDFPFDSTGRVKSTRDLRDGDKTESEAGAHSGQRDKAPLSAERVHEKPQESKSASGSGRSDSFQRDARRDSVSGDATRPGFAERSRDERPDRVRDERNDRARDERHARGRDERPDRLRDERSDRFRDQRSERGSSDRDDRVTFEKDDSRPSERWRSESSMQREPSPRQQRDDQGSRFVGRDRVDPNYADRTVRPNESDMDSSPVRENRSRDSKFVRRDERAKEVIAAALLAASRERELQRSASMAAETGGVADVLARVPGAEVAKLAAERIGESLIKSIRRAAPNLGGLLRKLGDLLEPEPSVVKEADSPEVHSFENEARRPSQRDHQPREHGSVNRRDRFQSRGESFEGNEPRRAGAPNPDRYSQTRRDEPVDMPVDLDPEIVLDRSGRPARDVSDEPRRGDGGRDGRRPSQHRGDNRPRGRGGSDYRHSSDGRRRNP